MEMIIASGVPLADPAPALPADALPRSGSIVRVLTRTRLMRRNGWSLALTISRLSRQDGAFVMYTARLRLYTLFIAKTQRYGVLCGLNVVPVVRP